MTDKKRISRLKHKLESNRRYLSIEQAVIITDTYRKNLDLSIPKKRALALKNTLENIRIAIDEDELIVGNRTANPRDGVVFPESGCSWVLKELDTINSRAQDQFLVREEDKETFRKLISPFWNNRSMEDFIYSNFGDSLKEIEKTVKINQKDHAQGHICPNVKKWLELGVSGLYDEARMHLQDCEEEQREFYECTLLVLEGARNFMLRYSDLTEKTAATNPEKYSNLSVVKNNCENLAVRPALTFHEALQSVWFLFVILHLESNASSFSPGRMDQYLWPYYQNDLAHGIIDSNEALELIECLFLKFNQIVYMRNEHSAKYFAGFPIGFNVALGGRNNLNEDGANELSYLFLQAQEDLGLPQPNLSVRLNKATSPEFLKKAAVVVGKGSGMPQFFNDEAIIEPLIKELDIEQDDACDYAIVGCVELTTQGNNLGWSDAAMFNINKVLELTLNNGKCLLTGQQLGLDLGNLTDYSSYHDLEEALKMQIDYFMEKMIGSCESIEMAHQQFLPSAFLSTVIDDCLANGKDVTKGGAKYNLSGIQLIQIANLADSLGAIKKLVYEQQLISAQEMLEELKSDFTGNPIVAAIIKNKCEKYGNDVAWVDQIGAQWALYFKNGLEGRKNYRHGKYHPGMYTVSAHVPMGENLGASPDGRKAREPLADGGLSPVYGRDKQGPTAVLKSVARIPNCCTTNGGLLNLKFLPDLFKTDKGLDQFCALLRGFVDLKVCHVQFNVVNKETLLEAQKYPDKFQSLTVRVAGYTAYFVELDQKLQNEIIARTWHDFD